MKPRVTVFDAVSADGYTEGFEADQGAFYRLVQATTEDLTLSGSNTILAVPGAEPDPDGAPDPPIAGGEGPVMAVIDSRGRIRCWDWLRRQPHWREVVVVGCEATSLEVRREWDRRGLRQVFTAGERVDLAEALDKLADAFDASTVRVESGGTLNGLLFDAGLVDELAVLIHPQAVGGRDRRSLLSGPEGFVRDGAVELRLTRCEQLKGGLAHLRYEVRN